MRILRQIIFDIVVFGSGALCSLVALAALPFGKANVVTMARLWARISLWALRVFCGVPVVITGLENLPAGGAVIAAQHQSTLDIFVWLSVVRRPSFVFKVELRRVPVFGWLLEPAGGVPVNRSGGTSALRDMVTGCRAAVAAGRQVIIFPEGTRAPYGERRSIKQGIAVLAQGLNVPVIPAATDSGRRWGRESFAKTPGPVHVKIFPALPSGLKRDEFLGRISETFYDSGPLDA